MIAIAPDLDLNNAGLRPGSRLGKYQIARRLALGGMAELYLARNVASTGFEKIVAIKRVLPHLAEDDDFVRMFLNEARLAAGLDHQNIVHVIDFGTVGTDHFMAMEYVHGRGVHEILKGAAREGGVPIACALTIVQGVAAALHYAHERRSNDGRPMGLVHRDVSPSNILVSHEGEVKLADFGIAKATQLTRATRTGTIKGKLAYMAPEQVRGEDMDRRADVFSLGAVLYELTTGRRCFYAPGEFALINRVAEGRFAKPTAVIPDFPPALEAIILRALRVDREDRYPTARAMQQAIEDYATVQGLQLSPIGLSRFMRDVFGPEIYPTTDVMPVPTELARASPGPADRTVEDTRARRSRGRRSIGWMVAAGGLGLVVGLAARGLLGSDDAAPQADSAPEVSGSVAAPEPVRGSGSVRSLSMNPTAGERRDSGATEPDIEIVETATAVVAEETPSTRKIKSSSRSPRHKKKSRSRRKPSPRKPKSSESAPEAPEPVQEYLPPSRRQ